MASAEAWSGAHCPSRGMLVQAKPSPPFRRSGCRPTDGEERPRRPETLWAVADKKVAARLDTRYHIGTSNSTAANQPQGQPFSPKQVVSPLVSGYGSRGLGLDASPFSSAGLCQPIQVWQTYPHAGFVPNGRTRPNRIASWTVHGHFLKVGSHCGRRWMMMEWSRRP